MAKGSAIPPGLFPAMSVRMYFSFGNKVAMLGPLWGQHCHAQSSIIAFIVLIHLELVQNICTTSETLENHPRLFSLNWTICTCHINGAGQWVDFIDDALRVH